ASYLVRVTSTLFPLLLTFLARRSRFPGTRCAPSGPQFPYTAFLRRFGSHLVSPVLVRLPARQDRGPCTSGPTNRHCNRTRHVFQRHPCRTGHLPDSLDDFDFLFLRCFFASHRIHLGFWSVAPDFFPSSIPDDPTPYRTGLGDLILKR